MDFLETPLPKPPAFPLTTKDWQPEKSEEEFHPNFWQILTGHQEIFFKRKRG